MMNPKPSEQAPLPGIWATIAAGFDLTAKNVWVLLVPVLLDLFLWLGPRLSFNQLLHNMMGIWQSDPLLTQFLDMVPLESLGQTNLWATLSVPLIGVPTLMTGVAPVQTPLLPDVVELGSYVELVVAFLALTVLGLLLTAVYFGSVATAVRRQDAIGLQLVRVLRRSPQLWLQLLLLALLYLALVLAIYLMTLPVVVILGFFGSALLVVAMMVQFMMMIWAAVYWFFVPHALVLNGRPLTRAVVESLQLVQRFLAPTMLLILVVLGLQQVMNWLMVLADDGSWLTGISLVAHAFVCTGLVTATFLFYRDRFRAMYGRTVVTKSADSMA